MKWRTHQVCGLGVAALLHPTPFVLGFACLGSILPDLLDQRAAGFLSLTKRGRQKRFAQIHRGLSHWFVLWFCVFALAYQPSLPLLVRESAYGLGLGGFFHVVLDMLTPRGVPIVPFVKAHVGIPLCSTGSVREYVFLAVLCCAFWWLWNSDITAVRLLAVPF